MVALMTLSVTRWLRKARRLPRVPNLASSAIRCRCVDRFLRLKSSPMFPVNGSPHMAPRFPRLGPGESSSPMSRVLSRCYDFPPRLSGRLFASLPRPTRSSSLCVSQLALPIGRRACRAGVIGQPATRTAGEIARGRERDLPGFQAIHPVPLPRSTTPAEPTIPRLLTVSSMLPPRFPRRSLQRLMNFGALSRGLGTCCLRFKNGVATIPARLASGWLARLCREGVEPSGSLQKVSDHPSSLFWTLPGAKSFAVGTRVTSRPPHRSVRAAFPHTAPTSGV
jgi:hypothetical protein